MSNAVQAVPEAAEASAADGRPAAMRGAFAAMRAAQRAEPYPDHATRIARLDALLSLIRSNTDALAEAIDADFGGRSQHETKLGELYTAATAIRYLKKHLRSFMKPRRRGVTWTLWPARASVEYQPLGVVGVISPWNYPFVLAMTPLATAIAAGNRVMLKPSEYTPRTSALLGRLLSEAFPPELVTTVEGGPELAAAFSELPFDHLLFTGSTAVGRRVMQAAARNLTPVTLELGGKSPALVHPSYPVERAATAIARGKWFNGGQTCIAPDYLLAQEGSVSALVAAIERQFAKLYPSVLDNPDYTAILGERHRARLQGLIDDAVAKGATAVVINPAGEAPATASGKLLPTLLLDVTDGMQVMQEEIFGPILPVVSYRDLDGAIAYIDERDRPLALYYFDDDGARVRELLRRTTSGGVTVNDTLLHFANDEMPFGGVGPSGMGAYHGREGFETFSHRKGVLRQSSLSGSAVAHPPYRGRIDRIIRFLLGN